MPYLVLVRHGESRWNLSNKFTGWVDVPLSEVGIQEALICGHRLEGIQFDIAFTSKLERAQETLLIILAKQDATGVLMHATGKRKKWSMHRKFDPHEIPILSDDNLNERYYGDLQGMNKDEARKKWGEKQVFTWRRSYDIAPPHGESLKDVVKRVIPFFKVKILPELKKGKNVIVSAHGNSLRAMVKYIDKISDEKICLLELPYATPIVYKMQKGILKKASKEHAFTRPVHWHRHKKQF